MSSTQKAALFARACIMSFSLHRHAARPRIPDTEGKLAYICSSRFLQSRKPSLWTTVGARPRLIGRGRLADITGLAQRVAEAAARAGEPAGKRPGLAGRAPALSGSVAPGNCRAGYLQRLDRPGEMHETDPAVGRPAGSPCAQRRMCSVAAAAWRAACP